jgi:hypothetical protein
LEKKGSDESKQNQYLKMLNEEKIKQPKEQALNTIRLERMGIRTILVA